MLREMVRCLGDKHHVDKVVEQFEEADAAVLDHLSVGSRRLPIGLPESVGFRLSRVFVGHGRERSRRPKERSTSEIMTARRAHPTI